GTIGNMINGDNRILTNTSAGINFDLDDSTPTPLAPTNNTISGNQISGNGATGIQIRAGSGTTIGPGNDIAGHSASGVAITTSQNVVKGNTVHANQIGIQISNGATGNVIGGSGAGEGNSLTNNTLDGVYVNGAGTTGNRITHTTTSANGGKGIGLASGG